MQKEYFYSRTLSKVSFREPTTSESISAAVYDFADFAKPQIFDPRRLQVGRIARSPKGVFANPLKDTEGKTILDVCYPKISSQRQNK